MFITLLVSLLFLVYWLNKRLFNYWTNRDFPQCETQFIFGSMKPVTLQKISIGEHFANLYHKFKKDTKVLGVYIFYQPTLIVTDPKFAQDVLIRDFSNFHDRPMPVDEIRDPLSSNLFNVHGQKWRDLRVKLARVGKGWLY